MSKKRAIMVMYDSLNLRLLQSYGCDWTYTPNFLRLAERCTQFALYTGKKRITYRPGKLFTQKLGTA